MCPQPAGAEAPRTAQSGNIQQVWMLTEGPGTPHVRSGLPATWVRPQQPISQQPQKLLCNPVPQSMMPDMGAQPCGALQFLAANSSAAASEPLHTVHGYATCCLLKWQGLLPIGREGILLQFAPLVARMSHQRANLLHACKRSMPRCALHVRNSKLLPCLISRAQGSKRRLQVGRQRTRHKLLLIPLM
eukprot:4494863-Amphidinium_carterae.1